MSVCECGVSIVCACVCEALSVCQYVTMSSFHSFISRADDKNLNPVFINGL